MGEEKKIKFCEFRVMEESQSSDYSPENVDAFYMTRVSMIQMDTNSYESLIAKTQEALSSAATEHTSFATLLKDCSTCINQSLSIVTVHLSEAEICMAKLTEYLSDTVRLLQLLSNFIKTVVESELMTYLKTFPTSVGLIIVNVFSHCNNSESLYGSNLSCVEKQLKDLFRNCHDLQLTYLKVLETHIIFDLTDMDEKRVLLEALNINLRIGETVHSLDVKTMAIQWKAMIAILEKYSDMLSDTSIFQDCLMVLCTLIRSNIKTNEANQDDKVVVRALKVANFLLKTLLKACDIFGHAKRKEYNNVLNLLFYIQETSVHLQMSNERYQFINLIASPSECLLKKLLYDSTFANSLLNCDIEKIKQEGFFLGFVLTITSVMDCLTQINNYNTVTKSKLINSLYSILPQCNSWNLDVTLWSDNQSHDLFEHMLIHALALALTLNCEEYSLLEKNMVEAILSTDNISASFSTNIWALLHMDRDLSPQLLFKQIVWLCTMYKKLEKHGMFHRSPQKLHLTHTITRLFSLMENDDKIRICKQFRIHDDDNLSLWAALGVKSLPQEAKIAAEAVVAEKLKTQFQCLNGSIGAEKIYKLTTVMNLAATCNFPTVSGIEDYIMKAWSKTCPERQLAIKHVYLGTYWFYDYVLALIALTESMWHQLSSRNVYLIKILDCVTSLIQQSCVEFKLLFINTLCKIATTDIYEAKLNDFTAAFTCLHQSEDIVRIKLFITLKEYTHKNIDRIISKVGDNSLLDTWSSIKDGKDSISTNEFKYIHKCLGSTMIKSKSSVETELTKASSGNFDFADNVDNLFGNYSDIEESACKKAKLDSSETEAVIKRLETETALLCTMKDNVFSAECRTRIQNVCDDLYSVINK